MKNWIVDKEDIRGNARGYFRKIDFTVCDGLRVYLTFHVFMDNADDWYYALVGLAGSGGKTVKCYTPEAGMKMADDDIAEICDNLRNFLDSVDVKGE